jgi:hypothetical protein
VLAFALTVQAAAQCTGSVTIVSPAEGAAVGSHFQVDATANSSCAVSAVSLYIDDKLQFTQLSQAALSGKFNAAPGAHRLVVQAWATDGKVFNKTVHITVNKQVALACATNDGSVKVCGPANLTESKGAVLVQATAKSSVSPVTTLKTFISGKLKATAFNENAGQIDAALSLPRGLQNINVVARSANGAEFHNETNVQIISASGKCDTPFVSSIAPTPGNAPEFPPFLIAADSAACSITGLNVYVDGRLFYKQTGQKIYEGRLQVAPGQHALVLQAWNSQGTVGKRSFTINVTGLEEPVCVPDTDPGVTVCQAEPTDNRYVIIFAGTSIQSSYSAMRIYVDNVARATFSDFAAQRGITFLKMTAGKHTINAVAWTRSGKVVTASTTVTVP